MKRVSFQVGGETVRGAMYTPAGVPRRPLPLVVLAHGLSSSRAEFYDFPQALADGGYAAFAIDFRGHGDSDGERGVLSAARAAQDLAAAVDAAAREHRVDADRLALLGHSLGAALVLHAAPRLDPGCVVALAPVHRVRDEMGFAEYLGYNALRAVNAPLQLLRPAGLRVPYKVDYERLYEDPAAVARAQETRFLQTTIPIKNYRALMTDLDTGRAAHAVRAPTLVLVARRDRVVQPASSRKVYEALGGPKEFHEIPRSGHSMCGDAGASRVAELCLRFLDRHLKGAPE